jgi:YD repeat-containing protein
LDSRESSQGAASAGSGTYDGNGNLTKLTSVNGSITQMAYNAANEICWTYTGTTSATCGNPPSGSHPYSYDANGQVLTRPDAGGTTTLGYNPRNQTNSDNPDGTGALTLGYLRNGQSNPAQIGNAPSAAPHQHSKTTSSASPRKPPPYPPADSHPSPTTRARPTALYSASAPQPATNTTSPTPTDR